MRIVIVLPAKDEADNIEKILRSLYKKKYTVIVINDGSNDQTELIAFKYTPYVLSHAINLGKGAALKTGCIFAFEILHADAVILMDSDGQHQIEDITPFIKKLKKHVSLILGVRNISHGMPKINALINKFISQAILLVFGVYIPDIPSGYKAFTHEMYNKIVWKAKGYDVELQIAFSIAKKNLPFETVPIATVYFNYFRGMTFLDAIYALWALISKQILTLN